MVFQRLPSGRVRLLVLALGCGILLAACNRDPSVRKQKYYDKATELLQKGKVQEAALELRNALKIDPNFVEAANILAEIQFRQRNYKEAYTLLQQVVAVKPDYLPARKGLMQLYRLSGKLSEAQSEAEYILDRSPDDIDTLLGLGGILSAQKKPKDAEGALSRILELQPNHVLALMTLASLRKDNEDLPGAERYLKLALARNPRSITVYLALIKFYLGNGRFADVEPLFSQALKVSNNRIEVLEAQLGYYEGAKKFEQAEAVIRKIQSLHPEDRRFWGAQADYYVRIGDWRKAEAELERLIPQHDDEPDLVHKLIEVHLTLNNRKSAEALNTALLKKNPRDSLAHLFKGRFYLADGDSEKAIMEFNETQKYQSNLPTLHYWYAQAYLQRGAIGQAKQALETAIQLDPGYQTARLALAGLQNRMGETDAAEGNAKVLMLNSPGEVQSMLVYSQSLLAKRDYAQAEKVVKAILERDPKNADAYRELGILEVVKKNLPAARRNLLQARNLAPDSKPILEGVLLTYIAEKDTNAALTFVQKEIQGRPQDADLYHELAQVYLLQNKRTEAAAALKQALNLAPGSIDSALLLAEVYAGGQETGQAIGMVNDLMQKYPQNSNLIFRAGTVLESVQRWDEARKAYERAVQLDSGNALAKNNLAWLLVAHGGNIDVALTLAQQSKEKLFDNLQVTNTIGWIY